MSLAIFAATIDDNSNITNNLNENENLLNVKRHQKTQRIYPKLENFDKNKVNSVIQQIHNNLNDDNEDENNYNPPPNPISSGVEKTKLKSNLINKKDNNESSYNEEFRNLIGTMGKAPEPTINDNLHLNDYNNYGDSKTIEEYYNKVLPSYTINKNINPINRQYYNNGNEKMQSSNYSNQQDLLIQKMNYMITLLEENQDEKTNNITEEVILYSFLGIFMIFLVDSFVKVGKYIR
jgi:hypothetical protein